MGTWEAVATPWESMRMPGEPIGNPWEPMGTPFEPVGTYSIQLNMLKISCTIMGSEGYADASPWKAAARFVFPIGQWGRGFDGFSLVPPWNST